MTKVARALTIAGSDSGGGAGIQADLKTFQELGVFGMSALTAVTAQNTQGVQGVYPLEPEAVAQQIDSVAIDIGVNAVKTGMLFSAEIIRTVAEKIKQHQFPHVVVDPVMIAKGGAPLLQDEAVATLKKYLLPVSDVITPNIPETEVLTGMKIQSFEDKKKAAQLLFEWGVRNVIIKGGHDGSEYATDILFDGKEFYFYEEKRIHTKNTHGTGCTFSAAIAAELAKGKPIQEAVKVAKQFITMAIAADLKLGLGHGPTNHWAYNRKGVQV